jgi:hypothetical protein
MAGRVDCLAPIRRSIRQIQPAVPEDSPAQPDGESRAKWPAPGWSGPQGWCPPADLRSRWDNDRQAGPGKGPEAICMHCQPALGEADHVLHGCHLCLHQIRLRNCGQTRYPCISGYSRHSARRISAPGGLSRYILTATRGLSGITSPGGWAYGIGSNDFSTGLPILP